MLKSEGYMMFRGIMRITTNNDEIFGTWLFRPDTDCWYCRGWSYPKSICYVLEDEDAKNYKD